MAATFGVVAFCVAIECGVSVPFVAAGDETSDVDALIAKLVGGDAKAGEALVAMGAAAVPRLTAALTDNPVSTRVAVLETLGRIAADHDEALPPLTTSLADKDAKIRAAAAQALLAAGPRAKPAVEQLKAALAAGPAELRVPAAVALIRCGETAGPLLPIVAEGLTHSDVALRILAIRALAAIGVKDDAVAAAVGKCAHSADATERAEALAAIPKLTDTPVAEFIHLGGAFRGDRLRSVRSKMVGLTLQVDKAVDSGLDWLARHQSPDGSWNGERFDKQCKSPCCDGPGFDQFTPGVTGLALLAFLGAGESPAYGPHKDAVARGVAYLRGMQGADGRIGSPPGAHRYRHLVSGPDPRTPDIVSITAGLMYDHAVATAALCEAYMLGGDPQIGASARKALNFVHAAKNPGLAWRYAFPPDGENDTSVTGWMCWALATADAAGIEIRKDDLNDAVSWVEKMTNPMSGRTGYQQVGGECPRLDESHVNFPADHIESMTSIGIMVRLFAGRRPRDDEFIDRGGARVDKAPPKIDVHEGRVDFYYWFWGSMAMRQLGGKHWRQWSEALKPALLACQRPDKDGCARGSWDPVDAWSPVGGRVYSTAMCCMCLESYWRMDSLLDAK